MAVFAALASPVGEEEEHGSATNVKNNGVKGNNGQQYCQSTVNL